MSVKTITTVVTQPASILLTSLYAVHLELAIGTDTANDVWFTAAINQVSRSIARYCNRKFGVASYSDLILPDEDPYPYQVPGLLDVLQLSHWPMVAATPDCTVVQQLGNGSTVTLVENTDFVTDLATGQLTRLSSQTLLPIQWEDYPVTVGYAAGYETQSEAWTVPTTPYQVQVLAPDGNWQADAGVVYASSGTALTRVASAPAQGQYALIAATNSVAPGGYQFAAADAGQAVLISYAYVPFDLEEAALRLVTSRFRDRGRDPYLKAKEQPGPLGREEYWIGSLPGRGDTQVPPEIQSVLDLYRVPVVH